MIWFATPLVLETPPYMKKAILTLTAVTSILFSGLSLVVGAAIIGDTLQYRGAVLTSADVPLVDKLRVVGFIAEDWKSRCPARRSPSTMTWRGDPGIGFRVSGQSTRNGTQHRTPSVDHLTTHCCAVTA